jgi:flagellar basal-body rod modification protein FlgD
MTTTQDIINSTIATTATQSAAKSSSSTSTSSTSNKNTLGKEDFLKLLVTQLKNQDPLNPSNSTEFTAQLAQFSSLEELTNLNTSMDKMVTATNNSTKTAALDMIGKEVTYVNSTFTYDKSPVQLGYTLDGAASQVQLLIQDSNGQPVKTLIGTDLTKGNHTLTWDGKNSNGNAMPSGTYKVIIQAKGIDSEGVAASPFIRSMVSGVDLSSAGTVILNTNAGDIDFSKILGVFPSKSS